MDSPQNVDLTIGNRGKKSAITSRWSEDDLADNQSYFTGHLPLRLKQCWTHFNHPQLGDLQSRLGLSGQYRDRFTTSPVKMF
jgi:hypothetical protein